MTFHFNFNNRTANPSSSLPTVVECGTKVSTLKVRKADRVPNSLECTSYDAPGAALSGLSRRAWTSRGHTCLKSVVLSSRTVPSRLHTRNLVGLSGGATDGSCGFAKRPPREPQNRLYVAQVERILD